ncbi:MAG: MoxR family ATPase [Candidatus Thorarchaeota archaeon]|nr:MoxR family ATPase [Candidatus Thorarchaeota archaeon]
MGSADTEDRGSNSDFIDLARGLVIERQVPSVKLVKKGQYAAAFEWLEAADAAGLTPALTGPPGTGKTLLATSYALETGRGFEVMTLDDSTRPAHLVGVHNPAQVLKGGYGWKSFEPGPLTRLFVSGGVFVANELNRANEFVQNSFLEWLEERTLYLPQLARVRAHDDFFMIAAVNPGDMAGTHRMSEALKDRIRVWIKLDYPQPSVEMDIIRANVPEITLSKEFIQKAHQLIIATRNHREIKTPASIRSAIAIVRMASQVGGKKKEISDTEFENIAMLVLPKGIEPKPGFDAEAITKALLQGL